MQIQNTSVGMNILGSKHADTEHISRYEHVGQDDNLLTSSVMSTVAPDRMSWLTTSVCPSYADRIRGVQSSLKLYIKIKQYQQ